MFEQTIYSVIYAKYSPDGASVEWEEKGVKALSLDTFGNIKKVTTVEDKDIEIDETTSFVRRSTTMFDKLGNALFSGDIVKVLVQYKNNEAKELLLPISWINAAYCIVMEDVNEIIYLTQQNVMDMEKIGDIYRHGKILERPVDEAIFEADKETQA